jgi:uncharacterized protein YkwD
MLLPTTTRPHARTAWIVLISTLLTMMTLGLGTGTAGAATPDDERAFWELVNSARGSSGLAPLAFDPAAAVIAREWSNTMAMGNNLHHNPDLASQVSSRVTTSWTRIGENVGVGYAVGSLHDAFMASTGHRANILGDYNRVGVGVVYGASSKIWVTFVFIKGPSIVSSPPASPPPPPSVKAPTWYLSNSVTGAGADNTFVFGDPYDLVLACDWTGRGSDTAGIFRSGRFYLSTKNAGTVADITAAFGDPGDVPVCGDWDGNGTDTIGIYRNGTFFLRNANTSGPAEVVLGYGNPGDRPVIGDWDGDGKDTFGIFRAGRYYLRNTLTTGVADVTFGYGNPTDRPFVGDWNGDGKDTIGIFRFGTWYLSNVNTTGVADVTTRYGDANDQPVVGDWDGNNTDSLGVTR